MERRPPESVVQLPFRGKHPNSNIFGSPAMISVPFIFPGTGKMVGIIRVRKIAVIVCLFFFRWEHLMYRCIGCVFLGCIYIYVFF